MSANFKPRRTVAAYRGFLAIARLFIAVGDDKKQESLAAAKVSARQQCRACMKAPAKKSTANQRYAISY